MSKTDDILETFGAPVIDDYFGDTVSYQRGTSVTSGIVATWDEKLYAFVGTDGLETAVQARDWVIRKTRIPTIVKPREGDLIIAGTEKYQVLPVGSSPAVEELPGGYRWLVHTVRSN